MILTIFKEDKDEKNESTNEGNSTFYIFLIQNTDPETHTHSLFR